MFSKESDVTVVLTSCGRFALLERTLKSFFEHNTFPIRKFILVEDSGRGEVRDFTPPVYRDQIDLIVNKPQIGQIASIDKAYRLVETDYIFHCEDDWLFYRPGFIEDSKKVLETEEHALMVWLRSYHHDLSKTKHTLLLGERKMADGVAYYEVQNAHHGNHCFSFNPALRRRADCPEGGYTALLEKGQTPGDVEGAASRKYRARGYFAVLLENDAVKHTGFDRHLREYENRWKRYRRRLLRLVMIIAAFVLGWWIGESR